MKILAAANVESEYFYEFYVLGKLCGYDLAITRGDLNRSYLEFLVTMPGCLLLCVHGNHDEQLKREPSERYICIKDSLHISQGVIVI